MRIYHLAQKELGLLEKLRGYLADTGDDWNYISPEELQENLDNPDYFLLDVRTSESYAEGHIPGTTNIFWLDLLDEENLKKLPEDKTIVVICYVGHTASQAMTILNLLGYDAVGLKFGMGISPVKGVPVAGWIDYNFEID